MRETLLARGLWGDFVRRREDLHAEGVVGNAATRQALKELAADLSPAESVRVRKRAVEEQEPKVEAKEAAAKAEMPVDESVFAGKTCSESAAIGWAFVRTQLGSARMEDAPSDKAWAYYLMFVKSPSAMVELVKASAVKLVAKEEMTEGTESFDGEREYDLLAKIAEAAG